MYFAGPPDAQNSSAAALNTDWHDQRECDLRYGAVPPAPRQSAQLVNQRDKECFEPAQSKSRDLLTCRARSRTRKGAAARRTSDGTAAR
jgi:hypothetical protein